MRSEILKLLARARRQIKTAKRYETKLRNEGRVSVCEALLLALEMTDLDNHD